LSNTITPSEAVVEVFVQDASRQISFQVQLSVISPTQRGKLIAAFEQSFFLFKYWNSHGLRRGRVITTTIGGVAVHPR